MAPFKVKEPTVSDPSGLLYLKFVCVISMIVIHTHYYLLLIDSYLATHNVWYPGFESLFWIGIFPLILPATAGAMLVERFKVAATQKRIPFSQSWRILATAAFLLAIGVAINWSLYRQLPGYTPYFQSTLQFLAISFLLFWVCCSVHMASLFAVAIGSLIITALYSDLRFENVVIYKVLFQSDGVHYLWPVFPWVGLVALGGALQWQKRFFFQAKTRTYMTAGAALGSLILISIYGMPLILNPSNIWGEAIFQKGGAQGITLMMIYFLAWLISQWLCLKMPPPRYGLVHVFGQAILYVYVFHMALGRYGYQFLKSLGHQECLLRDTTGLYMEPCINSAFLLGNAVMFSSCWVFAWIVCRYFMNSRLRIRLRPVRA